MGDGRDDHPAGSNSEAEDPRVVGSLGSGAWGGSLPGSDGDGGDDDGSEIGQSRNNRFMRTEVVNNTQRIGAKCGSLHRERQFNRHSEQKRELGVKIIV